MSNAMSFLEQLALRPGVMSDEELVAATAGSNLPLATRKAIVLRDSFALSALLGGRASMVCSIIPAENDEPVGDEEEQRDSDPEAPEAPADRAA
jgi:hypothetical protein